MKPHSDNSGESAGAIGESDLIRRIAEWLGPVNPPPPEGIGDDCAVYEAAAGLPQLITTDPVIDGYHFDEAVPPEWVGAKLLKRSISDVAAMGGRPRRAVVSLALPPQTRLDWLERFFAGLRDGALSREVRVVGGDVAQTDGPFAAFLTLVGEAPAGRVLTRRGAGVGDNLLVTGELGGSRAGHHYRFSPRVEEGVWLAGRPEVRAMIDLSDGAAKDLPALLPPGGSAELDWANIPLRDVVRDAAGLDEAGRWIRALCDGEDYELLFALDGSASVSEFLRAWREVFACPLTSIGRITSAPEGAGGASPIAIPPGYPQLESLRAYEHFRPE